MQTKLRPGKTISRKQYKVVANFTNGFAQNVLELEDGTLIFISYGGDEVRIEKRELLTDPVNQIPAIVNSTPAEEDN